MYVAPADLTLLCIPPAQPPFPQQPKRYPVHYQSQSIAPEAGVDAYHLEIGDAVQFLFGQVQVQAQIPLLVPGIRIIEIAEGHQPVFNDNAQDDAFGPHVTLHEVV